MIGIITMNTFDIWHMQYLNITQQAL